MCSLSVLACVTAFYDSKQASWLPARSRSVQTTGSLMLDHQREMQLSDEEQRRGER
eukprot:m.63371 g.63371  ORF g.63371 m.63371 type:complete len:56 (-) comp7190_c1_seq1:13-180(-)